MLSCGHSYCSQCISEMCASAVKRCPVCRSAISTPVHNIPRNQGLESLIESLTQSKNASQLERKTPCFKIQNQENVSINEDEYIQLKLDQNGNIMKVKVRRNIPLKSMFRLFCDKRGLAINLVRFLINGRRIHGNDTAKLLNLENDDLIEVVSEQDGGFFGGFDSSICQILALR